MQTMQQTMRSRIERAKSGTIVITKNGILLSRFSNRKSKYKPMGSTFRSLLQEGFLAINKQQASLTWGFNENEREIWLDHLMVNDELNEIGRGKSVIRLLKEIDKIAEIKKAKTTITSECKTIPPKKAEKLGYKVSDCEGDYYLDQPDTFYYYKQYSEEGATSPASIER